MGFTEHEKIILKNTILPVEQIEKTREEELSAELKDFLSANDYTRRVIDYILLPYKFLHKKFKTENIVLVKFMSKNFSVHDFVLHMLETLTMPFEIKIDFSFTIKNPIKNGEDRYRFVFPQRSTCLPTSSKLFDTQDVQELLDYLQPKSYTNFLKIAYETHKNQSCFDKSGYVQDQLLTCVFFLSKVSSLNAPIPV